MKTTKTLSNLSKFSLLLLACAASLSFNPAMAEEIVIADATQQNPEITNQATTLETVSLQEEKPVLVAEDADLKSTVKEFGEKEDGPIRAWLNGDNATGDWGGLRTWLEDHGVTVEASYTDELFTKWHGGVTHHDHVKYLGLVNTAATLETGKMGLWKGGKFYVNFQTVVGHSLHNALGAYQPYSSIDVPENMAQLSQYYYEQALFNDRFRVKLGKQDANCDFSALASSFNFLHSSLSWVPNVPMPLYPNPALGVATFIEPIKGVTLKGGFYDGEGMGGRTGFDSAFDGNGGAFMISEVSFKPTIKGLPGEYIAGMWYHNGDLEGLSSTDNPRMFASNHGLYTGFEQMLYKESKDAEDSQGLGVHTQFGYAPENRNEISRYYGLGFQYAGLLPKRDSDVIGIGAAFARFSDRMVAIDGKKGETALEMFYKVQLTPWLALQPDMQFIFNPGGRGDTGVVFGIRSMITF